MLSMEAEKTLEQCGLSGQGVRVGQLRECAEVLGPTTQEEIHARTRTSTQEKFSVWKFQSEVSSLSYFFINVFF